MNLQSLIPVKEQVKRNLRFDPEQEHILDEVFSHSIASFERSRERLSALQDIPITYIKTAPSKPIPWGLLLWLLLIGLFILIRITDLFGMRDYAAVVVFVILLLIPGDKEPTTQVEPIEKDPSVERAELANALLASENAAVFALIRYACRWADEADLVSLKRTLDEFTFYSLLELDWQLQINVSVKEQTRAYNVSKNRGLVFQGWGTFISDRAFEPSPEVFINYSSLKISLKSDFRKSREPLSREAIFALLESIMEASPHFCIQEILIKQFSSTKSFEFDYHYLQAGPVKEAWNRPRAVLKEEATTVQRFERNSKKPSIEANQQQSFAISSKNSPRDKKSLDYPLPEKREAAAGGENTTRVSLSKTATVRARNSQSGLGKSVRIYQEKNPYSQLAIKRKVESLISEVVAKRALTESIAMKAVMQYEVSRGRKPEDVSAMNVGYDILSEATEKDYRRIEVKGLSAKAMSFLRKTKWIRRNRQQNEISTMCTSLTTVFLANRSDCTFWRE
ncbi:unnamed protein product [Sphagnum jensenii]